MIKVSDNELNAAYAANKYVDKYREVHGDIDDISLHVEWLLKCTEYLSEGLDEVMKMHNFIRNGRLEQVVGDL